MKGLSVFGALAWPFVSLPAFVYAINTGAVPVGRGMVLILLGICLLEIALIAAVAHTERPASAMHTQLRMRPGRSRQLASEFTFSVTRDGLTGSARVGTATSRGASVRAHVLPDHSPAALPSAATRAVPMESWSSASRQIAGRSSDAA